jgi:hypothetical protein
MKPATQFFLITIFVATALFTAGCQSLTWWRKGASPSEAEKIMTSEEDIVKFDDFRTIEATDPQLSSTKKPSKSLLWENNEAREIERRLGVTQD